MRILFVCLGNICRSPTAEAIMNHFIEKDGLQEQIICDSAGTSAHHVGQPADHRMRKYAKERGYNITSISRPINSQDFIQFDYIITMDDSNFKNVQSLALSQEHKKKILKIADYCNTQNCSFIPDPYSGGEKGFFQVIDLLEEACLNLLKELKKSLKEI